MQGEAGVYTPTMTLPHGLGGSQPCRRADLGLPACGLREDAFLVVPEPQPQGRRLSQEGRERRPGGRAVKNLRAGSSVRRRLWLRIPLVVPRGSWGLVRGLAHPQLALIRGSVSLSTLFFWKSCRVRKSDTSKLSVPWVSSPVRVLWTRGGRPPGGGGDTGVP